MEWRRIYRVVFFFWIVVVAVLSVIPSPDNVVEVSDKSAHFIVYFITALLCYVAFRREGVSFLFLSGTAVFLYSVAMEVVQSFLPYRDFSTADMVANAAGIVFFFLVWTLYFRVLRPRLSKG